ncbi:MAG TPA: pseudouridine synthase [Cyclobacteriaceae bacterium]|nr:pseudouridine synthase [Cyclobacteriaceae bacterium]
MARERRAGGKTSFGKKTQAERNFRDRKSNKPERESGSEDRPRRKPFASRGEKPFARKSNSAFRKRDEGEGRSSRSGFRKSGPDRFSKFDKTEKRGRGEFAGPRRERPYGDKTDKPSFRKRDGGQGERRFGKRNEGFGDRRERPSFPKRGEGFGEKRERPSFQKRGEDFGDKKERTSFRKRDESGEGKFRKRDEGAGVRKFSRDDVKKVDDRFFKKTSEGEKPSFSKTEKKERSSNYGKPFRVREKKKSFGGPAQEHQRKNIDAGLKPEDGLIRLNKFMANSGVGSRREADEFIKMGLVTVNGETITEMGHKVKATDDVRYEGRKLKAEPLVYVLLNKPKGFITTTDDPEERNTVMDLVASACKERIYPVGRLDRNTTGLLLLTNDGDLADKLTHPSYNVKKIYKVELNRPLSKNDLQKILDGVYFEEGKAQVDDIAIVSDDGKEIGIELHIGWNRIVRRIFEALGYEVERLDRVVYAGLDKKDLGRGQWRFLKPEEVVTLKHFR